MLTTYEYDARGRVVRAYTASAWTEDDRALMLAWEMYRASFCKCGQPKDEAWHPDNDGWYEVTGSYTCNACTVLERASNDAAEPVTFHAVSYTRPESNPLPPFPTGARLSPEELAEAIGGAE